MPRPLQLKFEIAFPMKWANYLNDRGLIEPPMFDKPDFGSFRREKMKESLEGRHNAKWNEDSPPTPIPRGVTGQFIRSRDGRILVSKNAAPQLPRRFTVPMRTKQNKVEPMNKLSQKGLSLLFSVFSPCGRARIVHLLRYQRFAVLQYSFTFECLANGRIELVKYPG